MHINGKGDNKAWNKAVSLSDFHYPWEEEKAPATSFSALWDGKWLYCLFRVKDDSIITLVNKNNKLEVGASDRVEIFMARDSALNPYYCLEDGFKSKSARLPRVLLPKKWITTGDGPANNTSLKQALLKTDIL